MEVDTPAESPAVKEQGFRFLPPVLRRSHSVAGSTPDAVDHSRRNRPALPRPGLFSVPAACDSPFSSGVRGRGAPQPLFGTVFRPDHAAPDLPHLSPASSTSSISSLCEDSYTSGEAALSSLLASSQLPMSRTGLNQVSAGAVAAFVRNGQACSSAAGPRRVLIVDCRFEYEFKGGHIADAVNVSTEAELDSLLLSKPPASPAPVLIFHCEFSQMRGPTMCQLLRKRDRELNQYPQLFYPDVFILNGGYRQFFQTYPELCAPSAYVAMDDPAYSTARDDGMRKLKSMKNLKRSWSTSSIGLLQKKRLVLDPSVSPTKSGTRQPAQTAVLVLEPVQYCPATADM